MQNLPLIFIGKTISLISKLTNRGNGSTWPGHIALKGNTQFIKQLLAQSNMQIIIVAGTNGKTTTAALIKTGLEKNGYKVLQNNSGANLLNGIASTLLLHTNMSGKLAYDYALFEVDENALPLILKQITPNYLVLLNLFRDQLDRYGEINTIAYKWSQTLTKLSSETTLILNANDPQIAYLGNNHKQTVYFGLQEKTQNSSLQHAADTTRCPRCDKKLSFQALYFSHMGEWSCKHCQLKMPKIEQIEITETGLTGTYNKYNIVAASLTLRQTGLTEKQIGNSLKEFKPAFGRQEIVTYKNTAVQIFLSKNPTSFNQSFTTITELNGKILLIVLNDRIPDGRDISWIWDVDLPNINQFAHILIAGDRCYDMALRIKYEGYKNVKVFEDLSNAITEGINITKAKETFYIVPTYSAMLEVRKIITGKKIL